MGGNFSLSRIAALEIGGFDENFVRVAYRFEAEFAYRWRRSGRCIRYEAAGLIHRLKIGSGGTRTFGDHLTTLRPDHSWGHITISSGHSLCSKASRAYSTGCFGRL